VFSETTDRGERSREALAGYWQVPSAPQVALKQHVSAIPLGSHAAPGSLHVAPAQQLPWMQAPAQQSSELEHASPPNSRPAVQVAVQMPLPPHRPLQHSALPAQARPSAEQTLTEEVVVVPLSVEVTVAVAVVVPVSVAVTVVVPVSVAVTVLPPAPPLPEPVPVPVVVVVLVVVLVVLLVVVLVVLLVVVLVVLLVVPPPAPPEPPPQ
jgi:hypothetical protein